MKVFITLFLITFLSCNRGIQQSSKSILKDAEIEYLYEDILIKTRDGAEISGMMVRNKNDQSPKPVILHFTIYVRDQGKKTVLSNFHKSCLVGL